MTRPYFEEVQVFRENRFVWIFLLAALTAQVVPLLINIYDQSSAGTITDSEPVLALVIVVIINVLVFFLLWSIKLELKINADGIQFRLYPFRSKWKTIRKDDIETYSFHRKWTPTYGVGVGYRRNWMRKTESMNVRLGPFLLVELKNKKRYILGTQNLEGMERAVNKLFEQPT